jgi:hypothetical protein
MSRFSRTGFSLLLLALMAMSAVTWARRGDDVSRHQNATANMIRRLGAAVMYDDQQRRQQISPQVSDRSFSGAIRATDDGQVAGQSLQR